MLITGSYWLYTMYLDPHVTYVCSKTLLTFENHCQGTTMWNDCVNLRLHAAACCMAIYKSATIHNCKQGVYILW